ncbi:molybdopterin dehydrogenase FAD-binding protein [Haliangium ochraceum DSM 14365]|uniref:Molybdopterin dehydrogenase FAD-binding protein n=2 Tax=Haliangium ochraceum TaxID=80816 RepID=D0LFU5_HALO1|nr:molybdopterin dehydrogenase FAD-binding protein [Haliangium ochraceum DSM 14365]
MYPPAFEYAAPDTLAQALALLAEHGEEAKVMAGGQSLIPLLKLRFAFPSLVVDIGRLPGLDKVREEQGYLIIGALCRHAALARHPLLAQRCPLITAAAPQIADPLVRNLGTIGGSLAHADPAGDWGSVMLALDAEVVIQSLRGSRSVPVREFFQGVLSTVLEPDELLTEVRVPVPRAAHGSAYLKLERKVGDFATVGVAVHVELDGAKIARAGIALTAVGPQNIEVGSAVAVLRGHEPDDSRIGEAARLAAEAAEPGDDIRGSAEYKREVVRVYVERGLRQAVADARARS